jgi:ATPase family AAA domain-containing protein 2
MNFFLQDSDYPTRTPRKPFGLNSFGAGAVPAGGMLPGELAAGTPSNLGKIGDAGKSTLTFRLARYLVESFSALADADPLGVKQNVTFDEVGGLDDR